MLAAAVKKRDVIDEVSKAFGQKGMATKMSKEEWELVKEFCRILRRFAVPTDHVFSIATPVICDVQYLIDGLKEQMEEVIQQIEDGDFFIGVRRLHEIDHSNMAQACKVMHWKLAQYAEILWMNEAMLRPDPFHKGAMLRPGVQEATIAYVWFLLPCDSPPRGPREVAEEGPARGKELDTWLESIMRKVQPARAATRSAWDEFNQYLTEVVPDEGVFTPLSWWASTGTKRFPLLEAVARELLSVCATSGPTEHMFSVGNAIVTYKRSCLSPISIETLITMKCWLRADNKRSYTDVELDSDGDDDQHGVVTCARGDDQVNTNL
ncbi:uncharacterized protein LOC144701012 [Wolffia australiana]